MPCAHGFQVAYRFVSVLNEQGFIEGKYVPVIDGTPILTTTVAKAETANGAGNGAGNGASSKAGSESEPPASATPAAA